MKKFYSVKETAKILGVSTNTVYKYVDTGSLQIRRLGRGRIKIPYSALSLIADLGQPLPGSYQGSKNEEPKISGPESREEKGVVKFGLNDIVFFRIFRGLVLLGLGIIYLFDSGSLFSFAETIGGGTTQFLLSIMPFVLIFAGFVSILYDFKQKSAQSLRLLVHIFNSLVFTFYVITSWLAGRFGEIVFIAPLGILAVSHIARGIVPQRKSNFYDEYIRYVLLLAFFGGALITSLPEFFPIPSMIPLIEGNRNLFAFAWFFSFIPPLIYLLSPYGRNSKSIPVFFAIWSAVALVVATKSTIYAKWDIAYMSYLVAAFGIFFVLWAFLKFDIEIRKTYLFLYLFGWVGLSLILGLATIRSSQIQLIRTAEAEAKYFLGQTRQQVNGIFSNQKQILVEYSGKKELLSAIGTGNSEEATFIAKQVFDRISYASRVIVYNADGIGIGVYPVSSLARGADYSSRDYFLIAKSTYAGYITSVYESILGTSAVLQVEPIFENNKFAGLLGVAINIESFSKTYKPVLKDGSEIYFTDDKGVVVYSGDDGEVGRKLDMNKVSRNPEKLIQNIVVSDSVDIPRWTAFETISYYPLFSKISNLNINLTILFVFNLLISLGFGFIVTSGKAVVVRAGRK